MNQNAKLQLVRAVCSSIAICLVVALSFFAFVSRSSAWFSTNETVSGNGMRVVAKATSNLIISDDPADVTNARTITKALMKKTFVGPDAALEPATHDSAAHSLVCIADEDNVNPLTGMAKVSDTFTYTEATENVHYIEFDTFLGTTGSLTFENLTVSLDASGCFCACADDATVQSGVIYYQRTSSEFRQASPDLGESAAGYYTQTFDGVYRTVCVDVIFQGNYVATLHPYQLSSGEVSATLSAAGTLLPSSPAEVNLRVYFDGAMTDPNDPSGKAILRAANQSANRIFLGFSFTLDPSNS